MTSAPASSFRSARPTGSHWRWRGFSTMPSSGRVSGAPRTSVRRATSRGNMPRCRCARCTSGSSSRVSEPHDDQHRYRESALRRMARPLPGRCRRGRAVASSRPPVPRATARSRRTSRPGSRLWARRVRVLDGGPLDDGRRDRRGRLLGHGHREGARLRGRAADRRRDVGGRRHRAPRARRRELRHRRLVRDDRARAPSARRDRRARPHPASRRTSLSHLPELPRHAGAVSHLPPPARPAVHGGGAADQQRAAAAADQSLGGACGPARAAHGGGGSVSPRARPSAPHALVARASAGKGTGPMDRPSLADRRRERTTSSALILRPRRVVSVAHSYCVGLNRRLAHEIARLQSSRWEVTAVAPPAYRGDLRRIALEEITGEACELEIVPLHLERFIHLMFYERRLREVLRAHWDVVHCWEEPYVLAGSQVAAWSPREAALVFTTAQNISKRYPPPFNWLERYAMRRASAWIAVGHAVQETLGARDAYTARPCRVITLGVDTARFKPDAHARGQLHH